MTSKPSQITNK